jgi:hypothetical protein
VTAEALRAARGTVRCGRCGSAFDALARLSDEIPLDPAPAHIEPISAGGLAVPAAPESEIVDEYHFSAEDIEKVFVDARDWQKQFGGDSSGAGSAEQVVPDAEPPLVVDVSGRVEDITLEGERIRIETTPEYEIGDLDNTGEFERLRNVQESAYAADENESEESGIFVESLAGDDGGPTPSPPAAHSIVEAAAAIAPYSARATAAAAGSITRAHRPTPAPATPRPTVWRGERTEADALPDEVLESARPGTRNVLAWTGGSLALALLLMAQLVHHYRQDLARNPQVGPALRAVYGGLGLDLSPNWDLAAFELRQWGSEQPAGTDGRMSVRASLKNRASFAQPHPVLRLELEDRFGDPVAVRDFEPGEYLKNPSQATRMVGPGATSEAEIMIVDPGPEAVGYRLDVCLRESDTLLRCAQGRG